MNSEVILEHFLSLENHRNAIKVLNARIESELAKLPAEDPLRLKLEDCSTAFQSTYTALDVGVQKLSEARSEKVFEYSAEVLK